MLKSKRRMQVILHDEKQKKELKFRVWCRVGQYPLPVGQHQKQFILPWVTALGLCF
jgi:hypothetical protein